MKKCLKVAVICVVLLNLLVSIATFPAYASAGEERTEEMYSVAMNLYYGTGTEQDHERAFSYFLISGEINGFAPSQNMLGICFRDGVGVEQNISEAERYFTLAAEQGDVDAQKNLESLRTDFGEKYEQAINLYFDERYEEARVIFEGMNGYKRSSELAAKCREEYFLNRTMDSLEDNTYIAETLIIPPKGEIMTFGVYEQDNNPENGMEPIEWQVLEVQGDRALLISKYALDCQPFNSEWKVKCWENCSLRFWLNNDFVNNAFSEEERQHVLPSALENGKNKVYGISSGSETNDCVFLLSAEEAEHLFLSDEQRQCMPTEYSVAKGADTYYSHSSGEKELCWWWLRTSGYAEDRASNVNYAGSLNYSGYTVNYTGNAVRPAIWIN